MTSISLISSSLFTEDVLQVWNFEHSVEQYKAPGGTSKSSVLHQADALQAWLTKGVYNSH